MRISLVAYNYSLLVLAVLTLLFAFEPPTKAEDSLPATNSASSPLSNIIKSAIEIAAGPNDIVIKGKHGLRIKVTNNSDRPIVFDGENASAATLSTRYKCVDIDTFDELNMVPPTFRSTLSADTGSAVTANLPMAVLQNGEERLKIRKPVLPRLGMDEQHKDLDQERFGQRILWPGDSSEGIILFPAEESLVGAVISLPVCSLFDTADLAMLNTTHK